MDKKINQETLFNPQQSREINTINLEHNEPLVEHTLGQSHSTLSSGKNECISDPGSISTTKLFTKPIVFAPSLEWTVEQTVNTSIYSETLLNIFETLSRSPGGQALRGHAFFRSGATVQLKMTTSPFHSGKLVFYYVPPGVRPQFRESIYAKVQYPCVFVDAGNSTTAELNIPFVAIKDFFSTQTPDQYSDFGQIGVSVLNPLSIGTGGQTTINFALSLHPTQNQIAVPVLAHTIQLQAGVIPLVAEMLPEILGSSEALLGASAASAAAGAGVSALAGDMISSEQKTLHDNKMREDMTINNTSSTKDLNVSAPSLSNMIGMGSEHLSLYPERTFVKHSPSASPVDDEMDLQRIAQVPSLLQIRNWVNTDAPGTVLFRTSIDPLAVPSSAIANERYTLYPTYLAHVSSPFCFWRGSIDYHFSFASTEQHKGKLIAAWIPYDSIRDNTSAIAPNPDITTLSLYPNEVFDLSLNKEFVFSVPYNTETPYRAMNTYYGRMLPNSNTLDNINPTHSLGTLILMVYNRLSSPTTVTPTIQFNVFVKAGSDYQLRALRYNQTGSDYERIRFLTLQGLEVAMESSRGGMLTMPENRVGMSNAHVSNTSFQDDESEHNLKKLLSKYYPQIGFTFNLAANTTRRMTIANLPGLTHRALRSGTEADPRWRNLINHFRDIFAFWHGSINYFFIHNSTVNTPTLLTVSHDPYTIVGGNLTVPSSLQNQLNDTYATVESDVIQTANIDISETAVYSHMSNLRVNPTVEITAPYRSIYRRLYTIDNRQSEIGDPTDYDECAGSLDLQYTNPGTTDIPISLMTFQSLGSDFRFKYLIPPPSLQST